VFSCFSPLLLGIRTEGSLDVCASDELQDFVKQDDRKGDLEDGQPLQASQWHYLEHRSKDVDVENEEVEGEGESHGQDEPDVHPGRHHKQGLVL